MFKSTAKPREATCTRCGKTISQDFPGTLWRDGNDSTACKTGFYHSVGGAR